MNSTYNLDSAKSFLARIYSVFEVLDKAEKDKNYWKDLRRAKKNHRSNIARKSNMSYTAIKDFENLNLNCRTSLLFQYLKLEKVNYIEIYEITEMMYDTINYCNCSTREIISEIGISVPTYYESIICQKYNTTRNVYISCLKFLAKKLELFITINSFE